MDSQSNAAPAQAHPLPPQHFYSVEYPGYISSTSIPDAIETLGGQTSLNNVFRRMRRNEGRDNVVDLKFRPQNPFSHPVPGEVTDTNNLLLRVVKRKLRKVEGSQGSPEEPEGEYTTQIVGLVPKTLRFRSMADFQYQPDMSESIPRLRTAMDNFNAEAIVKFKFEPEKEDYSIPEVTSMPIDLSLANDEATLAESSGSLSNLNLIPPPVFSRQGLPQLYNFKQNQMSIFETSVNEETGVEKRRYINRSRWKGWSVSQLSMSEKMAPSCADKAVEDMRKTAMTTNSRLYKGLKAQFEARPIWTKLALLNQFPPSEARDIANTKYLIPLFCYVFNDGPWRDTLVKFDYDPRTDINARFFQRIYFRNVNNPTTRPSVTGRNDARNPEMDVHSDRRAHVFDGQTLTSETASFQLCDIQDPMLKEMIDDDSELRDSCHERDGWYSSSQLERVKVVLRHKFFSLLESHVATDEECQKILDAMPESRGAMHGPTYSRSRRTRKHNKAKGALPPEEEAVARLRKVLAQEKGKERESDG